MGDSRRVKPESKKCPNCKKVITYLQVSKQLEGTRSLEGLQDIEWSSEQKEPLVYTCPECLIEIPDEILENWGLG